MLIIYIDFQNKLDIQIEQKNIIVRGQVVELIDENDKTNIYTKINEVNTQVESILGLSYDQFRQIVMLPQGEFQQLLTAKSDEKTEIFRRLFETTFYDDFFKETQRIVR